MDKKEKISTKEIVWYSIAGFFGLVGITFTIFGIIGDHLPGLASDNWVYISENAWLKNWSHMGYRWWGLILLGVGLFIALISLNVFAARGERDDERAIRRAQRLKLENAPEVKEVTATDK